MQNGIFKLDLRDVADAVITAVVAAVVVAAVQLVTTSGFDLFTADWVAIGKSAANLATTAGVVTLGKALLSTNSGSLLGVGPTNQG